LGRWFEGAVAMLARLSRSHRMGREAGARKSRRTVKAFRAPVLALPMLPRPGRFKRPPLPQKAAKAWHPARFDRQPATDAAPLRVLLRAQLELTRRRQRGVATPGQRLARRLEAGRQLVALALAVERDLDRLAGIDQAPVQPEGQLLDLRRGDLRPVARELDVHALSLGGLIDREPEEILDVGIGRVPAQLRGRRVARGRVHLLD